MKKKNTISVIKSILKNTHTDKIIIIYVIFVLLSALLIWLTDPGIHRLLDALWYCYSVVSTAGFGDVVATGILSRIISVCVTVYTIFVVAIVTGVVVNYYTRINDIRNKETLEAFMDKLECLPELSKEELTDLSERVSHFRETGEIKGMHKENDGAKQGD